MAKKDKTPQWETTTLVTRSSTWSGRDKKLEKAIERGWEVISSVPVGRNQTRSVLRRPNPKYQGGQAQS